MTNQIINDLIANKKHHVKVENIKTMVEARKVLQSGVLDFILFYDRNLIKNPPKRIRYKGNYREIQGIYPATKGYFIKDQSINNVLRVVRRLLTEQPNKAIIYFRCEARDIPYPHISSAQQTGKIFDDYILMLKSYGSFIPKDLID